MTARRTPADRVRASDRPRRATGRGPGLPRQHRRPHRVHHHRRRGQGHVQTQGHGDGRGSGNDHQRPGRGFTGSGLSISLPKEGAPTTAGSQRPPAPQLVGHRHRFRALRALKWIAPLPNCPVLSQDAPSALAACGRRFAPSSTTDPQNGQICEVLDMGCRSSSSSWGNHRLQAAIPI